MVDKPDEDRWFSLYRRLPEHVYRDFCEVEKMIASRYGINLGDKWSTPGAWTELYERMCQHFIQMDEDGWKNF